MVVLVVAMGGTMIAQRVENLKPYQPGEQPKDRDYIKLNANENPYPPAPGVEKYLERWM